MASIKPTALAAYKAGSSVSTYVAGYESSSNRVIRYTFKSPAAGASAVSITCTGSSYGGGSWPSLRFYISESSTSHKNAGSGSAYTGSLSKGTTSGGSNRYAGSANIILKPNTTYYLWIFPASTTYAWCYWNTNLSNCTISTSGAANSVVSGSGGTLGIENTLTLTRYSDALTHIVTAACGTASVTIGTDIQADTVTWTPPVEWAAQNTEGVTVPVVVTCITYQGETELGSTSVTLSFAIPESVVPAVRFEVSDPQGHLDFFGSYVQSKSQAFVNITAEGVYGSTIKSYAVQCGSLAGTAANVAFELPDSGEITITVMVTDSRGRTTTVSTTISVAAYAAPAASITSRYRCDAEGNEDPEGAYALVVFDADITPLDNKNTASYAALYRVRGDEGWGSVELSAFEGSYAPRGASAIIPAESDKDYEVSIRATDYFGSVDSMYRAIQVAFKLYEVCKSRRAWGFGQKATVDNAVSFGLQVILNAGLTPDSYQGSGDEDEAALNDWLDTQLDRLTAPGMKMTAIHCSPVTENEMLYGFLCRVDTENAMLYGFSESGTAYIKSKADGSWNDAKAVATAGGSPDDVETLEDAEEVAF